MTLEQLRAIIAQLREIYQQVTGRAQDIESFLLEIENIIRPGSPVAEIVNIDQLVGNYTPQYFAKFAALAEATGAVGIGAGDAFTITASAGEGGTISPIGPVFIINGMTQAFTITPASGFVILDVLVDGVSVGDVSQYSFNAVNANHTIHATFRAA